MNYLIFDFETGGLDPKRHAPIQLAWILESSEQLVASNSFDLLPAPDDDFCLAALEVNNITLERLKKGIPLQQVIRTLKHTCLEYTPVIPVGYNVQFDIDFLNRACIRNGENMHSFLKIGKFLDVRQCIIWLHHLGRFPAFPGKTLDNYKLTSVCEYFGIEINAHDAMGDVIATRKLFHIAMEMLRSPLASRQQ